MTVRTATVAACCASAHALLCVVYCLFWGVRESRARCHSAVRCRRRWSHLRSLHSAPAAGGSCLPVLLSCGSSLHRFTISMGTQYNRACVPLTSVFKWATGSLRSLTNEEISKYLCHFFDFAGQAGELARNVALVQGTKSQMRGRSC